MKRLTPLWFFILILMAAAIYLPGLSKYLQLKQKETELHREIKRLETQIAQLEKDEHLIKTDLTRLEQVVREELGLVKPGETVVKVVEEEAPQKPTEPAQNVSR